MVLNKKTNQISVREICEATGINRSSFYLHYADIPALITAIVGEKWTESVERIHEEMHGRPEYLLRSICGGDAARGKARQGVLPGIF